MANKNLPVLKTGDIEIIDNHITSAPAADTLAVGQWYWVVDDDYDWLGCVTQLGSNFLEITEPKSERNSYKRTRVLLSKMHEELRFEADSSKVIAGFIAQYQAVAAAKLGEIKDITARLGVNPDRRLQSSSSGRELSVLSGENDVKAYKLALIKASKEDLPALFEAVKKANGSVGKWMSAELLPLMAQSGGLGELIETIEKRIFNVSLYAGLTEEVVQFADGEPAKYADKLHIMQRMLYMDEECLANYKTGGMSFDGLEKFDEWLANPENRDRILPFQRCMVALRVRREKKDRDQDGTAGTFRLNFRLGKEDMLTFIYLRNGDCLYRMNCDFVFDELIFPANASMGEPMMMKMFGFKIDETMTVSEFEDRKAESAREEKLQAQLHVQWKKDNPDHKGYSPHEHYRGFSTRDWSPVDDANVYFDECMKLVSDKIHYYNRIALIVQGLFDRSNVFHPHKPLKSWDPNSFADAVELVYDGSNLLYYGEAPDFEAYHAQCNASLTTGSIVTGQEDFWLLREGTKRSDQIDRTYASHRSDYRPKRYHPNGNEGPGFVSEIAKWQARAKSATFTWEREGRTDSWAPPIKTTVTVPADKLFNISAYKPGDFKQFYRDPRTRAKYVQWAQFFMAAEDYYAGHEKVQKPCA
jgi:hypothetical protein